MTATVTNRSLKAGVNVLAACRFNPRPGWWVTRYLGTLFARLRGREPCSKVPRSICRAGDTQPDPYLSALATADTVEHSLRLINEEIDEIETRLQKLALF